MDIFFIAFTAWGVDIQAVFGFWLKKEMQQCNPTSAETESETPLFYFCFFLFTILPLGWIPAGTRLGWLVILIPLSRVSLWHICIHSFCFPFTLCLTDNVYGLDDGYTTTRPNNCDDHSTKRACPIQLEVGRHTPDEPDTNRILGVGIISRRNHAPRIAGTGSR